MASCPAHGKFLHTANPSVTEKTKLAEEYAQRHPGDSYLDRVRIPFHRYWAYLAGYDARQAEVDGLHAHYNGVIEGQGDSICELTAKLAQAEKERDEFIDIRQKCIEEIQDLKEDLHLAEANFPQFADLKAQLDQANATVERMRAALEFYAQKPVPDISSLFAKSAAEWGEHVATWEPLIDLGERARLALGEGE